MKTTVVTTSTRSRLAEVAVLAKSLERHHPGQRLTCYLVEDGVRASDAVAANLDVGDLKELDLPDHERFCFQYPPFELCCAIKPFAMLREFDNGADRVVYIDGDMFVCAPFLDSLDHAQHDVLLTPHLGCAERETDYAYFLRAGTHNAGFLSAVNTAGARAMLSWWADRTETLCFHDYVAGVFADQSWLSLGSAIFDGVGRLPDAGINVGHWNVNEHDYREVGGSIAADDGTVLRVFHFSGFAYPGLTRHPSVMETIPPAIESLAAQYGNLLSDARRVSSPDEPYTFSRYEDGTPIEASAREAVRSGVASSQHPFADRAAIEDAARRAGGDTIFESRFDYQVQTADRQRSRVEELEREHAVLTQKCVNLGNHVDSYQRRPIRTFVHDRLNRGGQSPSQHWTAEPASSNSGGFRASILIVTRNNADTLARAVGACFAQHLSVGEFEIVLVDDGSDAPQLAVLDVLESRYRGAISAGKFRIIRCGERRGVGPRRNMSVREGKADILAVIDGDAFPESDWLEHVLEPFSDPSVGVVSSRVLFGVDPSLANGQGCTVSLYGFGLDRFVFQPAANLPDTTEEVLYAMGCGMAMRRCAWEAIDGFDEDIVYGYEDVDFSLRVWILGARVVTAPLAVVMHETISFDPPTRDRIFLYMRNRWLFLIKHWPITWIVRAAICQVGALLLTQDGRVHSPIFLRAMLSLARRVPHLLRARRGRAAPELLRRLIWPHWIGPTGLYRDIRLLNRAPLTPVGCVNWDDGDTFRLGGGLQHPGQPYVSVIDNGWCEIALFETSRKLILEVAPQKRPNPVRVDMAFSMAGDGDRKTTSMHRVESEMRLSVDVPEGATRCRIAFSTTGVARDAADPDPVVRLGEVLQK
jgi:GT2 family glycosyltransferase